MPLQFGMLANKFKQDEKFGENDHRKFRLKENFLRKVIPELDTVWKMAANYKISPAAFSLSFIMSFTGVSTVIPGIKNTAQAIANAGSIKTISQKDKNAIIDLYENKLRFLLDDLENEETG